MGRPVNRRGSALAAVLFLMLLIGALAGATLLAIRSEQGAASQELNGLMAEAAAQAGVARLLGEWRALRADSIPVGAAVGVGTTVVDTGYGSLDTLVRLGAATYLARVTGERRDGDGMVTARARLGLLLSLRGPSVADSEAARVRGQVVLRDSARVAGADLVPPGWSASCTGYPHADRPAIRVGVGPVPDVSGCLGGCATGAPPIVFDTLAPAGVAALSGVTVPALLLLADTMVAGTVTGVGPSLTAGVCSDRGLNWGAPEDPADPCFTRLPLIGAAAGTELLSGVGQGVLVSAGTISLGGDFRFYGLVVAGGLTLKGRSVLRGQAVIGGGLTDSFVVADESVLERSRCAIDRALSAARRPFPVRSRAWSRWP
jgi:hypothetical protein